MEHKFIIQLTEQKCKNARKIKYWTILYSNQTQAQLTCDTYKGVYYVDGQPVEVGSELHDEIVGLIYNRK